MEIFQKIADFFNNLSTGGMMTGILIVVEFVLRLTKSDKPRSILIWIANAADMIAKAFRAIADFFAKLPPQSLK